MTESWPVTAYDVVAQEANRDAPERRTTAEVRADEYDGENVPQVPSCGQGACPHWRMGVECPSDPWGICVEGCDQSADPGLGGCNHGLQLCPEHASTHCPECRYDIAAAEAEVERKRYQERGWHVA